MNATAKRESAAIAIKLNGVDPLIVDSLIEGLMYLLRQCHADPTPEAAARIVEPPWWRPFKRAEWRIEVAGAVAKKWTGPRGMLPAVQAAVLERLRRGVSAPTLAGLYGRQG